MIPDWERVYRAPQSLAVTPLKPNKILVLGSCLVQPFVAFVENAGTPVEFMLLNQGPQLPSAPPAPVSEYDFQIVQIPLRAIVPDMMYRETPFNDLAAHQRLFQERAARLDWFLDGALQWNRDHGIVTFLWSFLTPQQNPTGRLLPRYDLRNMVYFVEELNKRAAQVAEQHANCYFFDLDACLSTFGRRYFQDDVVAISNHASQLGDADFQKDADRLDGRWKASEVFPLKAPEIYAAMWQEMLALYRTVRRTDEVKLVITDLDDTLWRGIVAEGTELSQGTAVEGWPIGYAEALQFLRRRGVMLAVASKNDETRVVNLWAQLYGKRIAPSDFAAVKINWLPKAENVAAILAELNILPQNVVFVDDNPVERAAIQSAFPGIRTLGPNPLLWRHTLLWAPETQVANITLESATRTEMARAQVEREQHRQRLSREDFLGGLDLKISLFRVDGPEHKGYARALELLNKTNQFNTTGRRWTEPEFRALFGDGATVFAFDVQDKFTNYGIVGVAVVNGSNIAQFVMSCRVVGMDVERAVMAKLIDWVGDAGFDHITAETVETPANLVSRDLFERSGFNTTGDGIWSRATRPSGVVPQHAKIIFDIDASLEPA